MIGTKTELVGRIGIPRLLVGTSLLRTTCSNSSRMQLLREAGRRFWRLTALLGFGIKVMYACFLGEGDAPERQCSLKRALSS